MSFFRFICCAVLGLIVLSALTLVMFFVGIVICTLFGLPLGSPISDTIMAFTVLCGDLMVGGWLVWQIFIKD